MDKKIVITIARGYGSGGKTIGKMLAKELGIPYYDRELLYMASEESGINLSLFHKNDEDIKKGIFEPAVNRYDGKLIPPEDNDFVSKENLFNYQAKIIKDLAEKESCIIVGRCADFILKDTANTLKVFIWAPHQTCVNTVMDMYSITEKEADKRIRKIDKHRSEHYHYYTGQNWDNVRNYDLCLNTAQNSYEECVKIIKSCVEIIKTDLK